MKILNNVLITVLIAIFSVNIFFSLKILNSNNVLDEKITKSTQVKNALNIEILKTEKIISETIKLLKDQNETQYI